jgi:hypothetical protein
VPQLLANTNEEEALQREHVSERLIEVGQQVQQRLRSAEAQIVECRGFMHATAEMRAEIDELRDCLDSIITEAKAS